MAHNARPYPFAWNLIPLLGGIIDPVTGVFTTALRIFCRGRIDPRADSPRRRRRGLTVVLGGIEGPSQYSAAMARGVLRAGFRGAVVRYGWNRCIPVIGALNNLMNRRHLERRIEGLVRMLVEYGRAHRDAPIYLFAQSGGCFVAISAVERLPADVRVQSIVLLAPSISPDYDLRPAAERCERAIVSVGGPGDYFFLGLGTTVFGTSDRRHTPSAGWIGWHARHPRFVEMRWHPDWLRYGYLGNHTTTSSSAFVRSVLGDWFRGLAVVPERRPGCSQAKLEHPQNVPNLR